MKTYRFFEVRAAVEAVAQKLIKAIDASGIKTQNNFKVTISWSKNIGTAAISEYGDMYLADRPDDELVTRATLERYTGKVVHEILHRAYTDFRVHGAGQYLHQLHNALEDAYIENSAIAAGLLGNIGGLMGNLADALAREALAQVKNWDDPAQFPFMLAIMGRKHGTVALPTPEWVKPIFETAVQRVATAKSTRDTLKIAEWVLAQLQQAQPKTPTNPKPNGKPQDGKGPEGNPCENGKPNGPEGGAKDGNGKGESKGEGKSQGNGKSQGQSQGDGKTTQQGGGSGRGDSPITANSPANDVHGAVAGEAEGRTQEGGKAFDSHSIAKDGAHLGHSPQDVTGNINARAKKQVRDMFEKTGLDEFDGGKKSGSLDTGALAGAFAGKANVFKRRIEEEGTDSAVILLIDVSSSMWDYGKEVAARKAAAELTRTLTRAGVEVAIVTFNGKHSVAHKFSTNKAKLLDAISRIRSSGGTNDYAAVRTCHTMLAKHSAERKVLFVISDGDGYVNETKAQVAAGRRLGITTIAVGIGHRVDHVYGAESAYVADPTKLGEAMFGKIKLAA